MGSHWVYVVKHHPDGTVELLKAQLVAKGYAQTFGVDYFETFSPVACLNLVSVVICCCYSEIASLTTQYQKCFFFIVTFKRKCT